MTKRCTSLIDARSADAQSAQPLHSECTARAQRLTDEEPMNLVPIRPPGPHRTQGAGVLPPTSFGSAIAGLHLRGDPRGAGRRRRPREQQHRPARGGQGGSARGSVRELWHRVAAQRPHSSAAARPRSPVRRVAAARPADRHIAERQRQGDRRGLLQRSPQQPPASLPRRLHETRRHQLLGQRRQDHGGPPPARAAHPGLPGRRGREHQRRRRPAGDDPRPAVRAAAGVPADRRQRRRRHRREQRRGAARADAALPRTATRTSTASSCPPCRPASSSRTPPPRWPSWRASACRRRGCGWSSTRSTTTARSTARSRRFSPTARSTGVVQPRLAACISFNEVYALVRGAGQSLAELAADGTDYKARDRQGRTASRTSWRWRSGWRPSGWPAASSPNSTRASRRWTCSACRRASRRCPAA